MSKAHKLDGDALVVAISIGAIGLVACVGILASAIVQTTSTTIPKDIMEEYNYCTAEGWQSTCYLEYDQCKGSWRVVTPAETVNRLKGENNAQSRRS